MADVKLHGFWPSPFSHRVIWALKIKGVDFDYIEEDLPNNKSELLLKYNPVYKKIPVLIHGGKPISESLIILEYIEEVWPQNPLLPSDPCDRAVARFWMQFLVDKSSASRALIQSTGEEKEKAAREVLEVLKVVEEQALGDKKFFGGEAVNMVDLSYGLLAYWVPNMEKAVGVKLLEAENFPRLHQWARNFLEIPVIKENLPDREKMLGYMRKVRERFAPAGSQTLSVSKHL